MERRGERYHEEFVSSKEQLQNEKELAVHYALGCSSVNKLCILEILLSPRTSKKLSWRIHKTNHLKKVYFISKSSTHETLSLTWTYTKDSYIFHALKSIAQYNWLWNKTIFCLAKLKKINNSIQATWKRLKQRWKKDIINVSSVQIIISSFFHQVKSKKY